MDDQLRQWTPPTGQAPFPASEPAAATHGRRLGAGWWLALVLVAAVLGVWALGGFKEHIRIERQQVGHSVDIGPATVNVTRAVAKKNYSGGWDVRAYGTCQVDEGTEVDLRAVAVDGALFGMAEDIEKREGTEETHLLLDPQPGQFMGRDYLAQGLEPMSCAFQGRFDETFDPSHHVLVQFVGLEFRDTSVTQNQDPVWTGGTTYYRYSVPVKIVTQW